MTSPLQQLLRQQHLRVGKRSELICKILGHARTPVSVQDIAQRAVATSVSVSLATIRRTLNRLTAAGLLRRTNSPGRRTRYERVQREPRESLIDHHSGQRHNFHSEGIEGLLQHLVQQAGYRLLDYRLELFGVPTSIDDTRPLTAKLAVTGNSGNKSGVVPAEESLGQRPRRQSPH